MKVSVLRPWWESGVPERQRNRDFTRAWWERSFPDWQIVEGPGEHSARSQAINWCAERAAGDVLIVSDVDCWITAPLDMDAAARSALDAVGVVYPFGFMAALAPEPSERVVTGAEPREDGIELRTDGSAGGCVVISRQNFDDVGEMDENFVGWGFQDSAFQQACWLLLGPEVRMEGPLWHLWHPPDPEFDFGCPSYLADRARAMRYDEALGARDSAMMRSLVGVTF